MKFKYIIPLILLFFITSASALTITNETPSVSKYCNVSPYCINISNTNFRPIELYENFTNYDGSGWGSAQCDRIGQTFTIGATGDNENFTVLKVDLYIFRIIPIPSVNDVELAIQNVNATGMPIGPDLCNSTIDGNALPTSISWITFNMSCCYQLQQNTTYALVLRAADSDPVYGVYWGSRTSNPYPGGQAVDTDDCEITWDPLGSYDFCFKVWGTGGEIINIDFYNSTDIVDTISCVYQNGTYCANYTACKCCKNASWSVNISNASSYDVYQFDYKIKQKSISTISFLPLILLLLPEKRFRNLYRRLIRVR